MMDGSRSQGDVRVGPEAEKGTEMDSPSEPPEGAANTLTPTCDVQNSKRIKLCCLKPLILW